MKLLLDTNVALDFLERREPHFQPALELINFCRKGNHSMFIAAHSIDNMVYVLKPKIPLPEMMSGLKMFLKLCEIAPVDHKIIYQAINSKWKDFEDALQHFCALNEDVDFIASRDKTGFKKSSISVLTPAAMIQKLQQ